MEQDGSSNVGATCDVVESNSGDGAVENAVEAGAAAAASAFAYMYSRTLMAPCCFALSSAARCSSKDALIQASRAESREKISQRKKSHATSTNVSEGGLW